jgi:hypothetical protein
MATTAGLRLDQDLARAGGRNVPFLLHQRFTELLDDGDVHFAGHWVRPFRRLDR